MGGNVCTILRLGSLYDGKTHIVRVTCKNGDDDVRASNYFIYVADNRTLLGDDAMEKVEDDTDKQIRALDRAIAAAHIRLAARRTERFQFTALYGEAGIMYRFRSRANCEKVRALAQRHGMEAKQCLP